MSNFVDDNTSLPYPKTDGKPLAVGADPTQWVVAADWNAVCQALVDTRTVLQADGLLINVKTYGAVGDGVADDAVAIQAAINAAAATVNGAFGALAYVPKGTYLVGTQLTLPNGVGLRGAGPASSIIKAKSTFNAASLIRNTTQDGTQEFAFLEGLLINGNQAAGAVCSTAVVDFVSLFVNSYIRDVIVENGSNIGLHVAAAGTPGGMGPILVENVWVSNCIGHNVLFEEVAGNAGAAMGITCVNLVTEHQGTNKSALYLKGLGSAAQWNFFNTHIEMGGAATGRTAITIDGVPDVLFDGVQLLTGGGVSAGILITNVAQNTRIQVRGVSNVNLINPVISDLKNGVTVGAINVPVYVTPEVNIRGGVRFTPDSGSDAVALVAQDSAGVDRAWFDKDARVTGASLSGAGLDVVGDATNDRALMLLNHAKSRTFGWYFPDSSNFRFRYFTGGVDLLNFDNSGNTFVYNPLTIQLLMTLQSALKGAGTAGAAPSTGSHVRGEIVFNADPSASGFIGWVCVTAGSPGTWQSFGAISPTSNVPTSRVVTTTSPLTIGGGASADLSADRTLAIATNGIDYTLQAQAAANSIVGNNTGSTANKLDLTATQVTAMLNAVTSSLKGLAPASGGGTTNFLRADATWASPASIPTNAGDPNGVVSGTKGSILEDTTNAKLWMNTTGSNVWAELIQASSVTAGVDFGDGNMGAAVFDGSTAVTGCTRSGSVYKAIQDLAFTTATFSNGVTLDLANLTAGFALNCSVSLVGPGSGSARIQCDGNAGVGATAGIGLTNASPLVATSGAGADGTQNAGTAPVNSGVWQVSFKAGAGGTGGADGSGAHAGGAGGIQGSSVSDAQGSMLTRQRILTIRTLNNNVISGGGGGGAGGGTTGVAASGGGGGGGGWCIVNARLITNSANLVISASGGVGGNGVTGGASVAGGGGGGGGGYCILSHGGGTSATGLVSGTNVIAAGGAGGSGVSTGHAGSTGGTGQVRIFNLGVS